MNIKKYLTGSRGTILRFLGLTAFIPLIISLLIIYFTAPGSLLSTAKQNMRNTSHHILKMCEIQSEGIDKKLNEEINRAFGIARQAMSRYKNSIPAVQKPRCL